MLVTQQVDDAFREQNRLGVSLTGLPQHTRGLTCTAGLVNELQSTDRFGRKRSPVRLQCTPGFFQQGDPEPVHDHARQLFVSCEHFHAVASHRITLETIVRVRREAKQPAHGLDHAAADIVIRSGDEDRQSRRGFQKRPPITIRAPGQQHQRLYLWMPAR